MDKEEKEIKTVESKPMEQTIFETEASIKEIIESSNLNVAVLELILRNIYSELREISIKNLQYKMYLQKKSGEEIKENG